MPLYAKGDEVQRLSDPSQVGVVVDVLDLHAGVQWYRVRFDGTGKTKIGEDDLRPYKEGAGPKENLVEGRLAGYREFQRAVTYSRLVRNQPLKNNIYAFNASRTQFYPYQFKPLLKFLDSPTGRMLIADEVGLGKTIEAGLILTEMKARQTIARVLIVCPSNLTSKWNLEMKNRFGEKFQVCKARDVREILKDYAEHPESTSFQIIASLQVLRADNLIDEIEATAPNLDLVIVDEAHHMRNPGTLQHKLGKTLGSVTQSMLMLSATPVQLGNQDLHSLFNILDESQFPDLETTRSLLESNEPLVRCFNALRRVPCDLKAAQAQLLAGAKQRWIDNNPLTKSLAESCLEKIRSLRSMDGKDREFRDRLIDLQKDVSELSLISHIFSRTKRRDVHEFVPVRKAHALRVTPTPDERKMYDAITEFVREASRKKTSLPLIQQWMLHMPQRRSASSIHAMVNYYKHNPPYGETDIPDDFDLSDNDEAYKKLDNHSAAKELRELIDAWPPDARDTKYEKLIEILKANKEEVPNAKLMLFAFFKDTLRYLERRLEEDGFETFLMMGDTPPKAREEIMKRFKESDHFAIMLASRVGSEGLDFQFCDTLFNYDLPWNPMEVEQRIGRLDRIGQQSPTIQIYNFWVDGTIEARILERLLNRIGIFESSIGDLEPIIGEELLNLERDLLNRKLTPEEEKQRIEESAMALERKRKEFEALERDASRFLGTDDYFMDQVSDIKKKRRYVTPQQLQRFFEDFLRAHCPKTRLEMNEKTLMGTLYPGDDLKDFITRHGDPSSMPRYVASGPEGVPITFDSDTAFRKQYLDFLTGMHPLTQLIVSWYEREKANLTNAHHVVLRGRLLPPGTYFYFVYRRTVEAARRGTYLDVILLDQNLQPACSFDLAEEILGEAVERGEEPDRVGYGIDLDRIGDAVHQADGMMKERIQELRVDLQKSNDLFIQQRQESLEIFYKAQITKLEERARNYEERGRGSSENARLLNFAKGLRTRIANLKRDARVKREKLEEQREISIDYSEVSGGFLQIFPDK